MVCAVGTPQRHPESGVYFFRKRVPGRLRAKVGKAEIKFSLRTRDPVIARLRNLEAMVEVERAWAAYDAVAVSPLTHSIVAIQCKAVQPAATVASEASDASMPTAADRPGEARATDGTTLRTVFASYATEAELARATVKRWAPIIGRFVDHLGHDDPRRVSKSNLIAWKDLLLRGKSRPHREGHL